VLSVRHVKMLFAQLAESASICLKSTVEKLNLSPYFVFPPVSGVLLFVAAPSGTASDVLPSGAAFFYQTPSGLVLASPSTSTGTVMSEGYLLSVPSTPSFALPPKVLSGRCRSSFSLCCLWFDFLNTF